MVSLFKLGLSLVETNYVPDLIVRRAIRKMIGTRLDQITQDGYEKKQEIKMELVEKMKTLPIAIHTEDANEQHYEVPTEFFKNCGLGKRMKYSCCYFENDNSTLDEAEVAMLELYGKRLQIQDGNTILELGCGWGSITLWMAEKFPNSKIWAVSNSSTQKEYIMKIAKDSGFKNVNVVTCDMNDFEVNQNIPDSVSIFLSILVGSILKITFGMFSVSCFQNPVSQLFLDSVSILIHFFQEMSEIGFDKVISIEMFEHMKNYQKLMSRISSWLKPGGMLFVHHFSHINHAYEFEMEGEQNWMARNFFSGGNMPSNDFLLYFQENGLKITNQWIVNGSHYAKTSEAWLQNLDKNSKEALRIMGEGYGEKEKIRRFVMWRLFYLAVAEMFNFQNGEQWVVSHLLFTKQ